MRSYRYLSLLAAAAATAQALPAQAVVLENKWQAGQKLSYDMALDGSLNLNAAPDEPVLWAGVPLEVQLKGKGVGHLETLTVDPAGTGTITVKLPQLSLQGEALGQKGELQFNNGKGKVMLNGRALALGGNTGTNPLDNAKMLTEPEFSWKITKSGKLAGIEKIGPAASAKADGKEVPVAQALDNAALMQALILRTLPTLWPSQDVQVGDNWEAVVQWPKTDGNMAPEPLGQFLLTLDGVDEVDGKQLQRVKVDGEMDLDAAKLADLNKEALAAAKKGTAKDAPPILTAAGQKLKGVIWFDSTAGRISKADLQVNARGRSRAVKPGGKQGEESWADFTGTVKFALRPEA